MPFLPPNQQRQSTEGNKPIETYKRKNGHEHNNIVSLFLIQVIFGLVALYPTTALLSQAICMSYDIKLVFVQKITFVLRKINKKLLPPELHVFTPVCTKSFVGFGRASSVPADPLAVFRGPTSKGGEEERRRGEFVL